MTTIQLKEGKELGKYLYNILAIQNSREHINRMPVYGNIVDGTTIKSDINNSNTDILVNIDEKKNKIISICSESFNDNKKNPNLLDNVSISGSYGTSFPVNIIGINSRVRCKIMVKYDTKKDINQTIDAFLTETYIGIKYINPFLNMLPNFVETYGLYVCHNLREDKNVKKKCLGLDNYEVFLLTEQVENSFEMHDYITHDYEDWNEMYTLQVFSCILQAIYALETLNTFRIYHNDCHTSNILMQQSNIESYNLDRWGVTINTFGIASRIIDYGMITVLPEDSTTKELEEAEHYDVNILRIDKNIEYLLKKISKKPPLFKKWQQLKDFLFNNIPKKILRQIINPM